LQYGRIRPVPTRWNFTGFRAAQGVSADVVVTPSDQPASAPSCSVKMSRCRTLLRGETLFEIADDVVLVLDADRQSDDVRAGAGDDLLRVGELPVRSGCRMDDQRAGVADIGEVREQLYVGDKLHAGFVAALEAEGEDRARALRHILAREIVIAVAGEP